MVKIISDAQIFRFSKTRPDSVRQSSLDYLRAGGAAREKAPIAFAEEELAPGLRLIDGRHRLLVAREQGRRSVDAVLYRYRDGYLLSAERIQVTLA